ncbi:ubiquitin carboxyl-terminal hydrolase-domain-containing protein [Rhypophila decipiens]|uniref:PAN2-PAN3 deadenylation complex catalytic subunit PAN2 n=1 Tax=Rhypophila decipiens TaxID=261697 RepID=A0AAN6YP39_9PEZI|nr:ubiquitin carboxyl-terminal hydrolase-domain-containing protein [Rhypophila decipiens]
MEADWDQISQVTFPVQSPGSSPSVSTLTGHPFQRTLQAQQQHAETTPYTTAVAFDTKVELLWIGGSNGRVSSYTGPPLQRYTSWRVQPAEKGVIQQFLFNDKGVIILGTKTVLYANRRGIQHWLLHHDPTNDATKCMQNLQCMSFTSSSKPTEILVAGAQETMLVIDVTKGEIVKQLHTEYHYTIMKRSRHYICAATTTGSVHILDSTSFQITKTWQAHAAFINDMDVRNDLVVTCGGSIKHLPNQPTPTKNLDHYVNAFDLAKSAAGPLTPVSLAVAAAHARLHPKMSSTTVVVAPHGQIHVVDLLNSNAKPTVTKLALVASNIKLFDVASSAQAFVITDGNCNSRLWGSPSKHIRFSDGGTDPIGAGPPVDAAPEIRWNDDVETQTPLSTVGMPFYREALFSAWPADLISDVGAPPVQLPPAFLATLKKSEVGWYGPNTRGLLRNQQENTRASLQDPDVLQAPKFLSQKARESGSTAKAAADPVAEPLDDSANPSLKPEAPQVYREQEIKYSKYGVDDFDFGYYNKTQYAGLENQIPNSYANALLQLMNYTPLLRNLALQHAASSCLEGSCILCEMGFVFDMLQKAGGSACHATNMLSALASNSTVQQEQLLEDEAKNRSLTDMAQGLCRFFFNQAVADYKKVPPASSSLEQTLFATPLSPPLTPDVLVDKVLTMTLKKSHRCLSCHNGKLIDEKLHVVELLYPPPPAPIQVSRGGKATKRTFSQVLKTSVDMETVTKGYCVVCRRYNDLQRRRTIDSGVPAVLALNAAIKSPEARSLWATPGWLPQEIGVIVDQNQFFCYEGPDLEFHLQRAQRAIHKIKVYSLVGMVVNIEGPLPQSQHLAALINVTHSEPAAPPANKWHLFNDFHVRPVSSADALTFNTTWKSPSVIIYQLKEANNTSDPQWKTKLDTSVLLRDPSRRPGSEITYEPLDRETEMPVPGSTVALDAEFVSLRDEEIHLNEDGQKETVRPKQLVLARVSVVRGQGEKEGVPFIDDYISIKGPIHDHLTAYSGIYEGDLDPRTSRHHLVPLKVAYKKLWVLVNLGCVFVGHGLKQDLRVINIQIPRDQVIDTIEKFKIGPRKLSLRFLTWCVMKKEIQMETHDSIEDAHAALMLYKKYLEFNDAGILEERLQEISTMGKKYKYKVPSQPQKEDATTSITTAVQLRHQGGTGTPPSLAAEVASSETTTAAGVAESCLPHEQFNPRRAAEDIFRI